MSSAVFSPEYHAAVPGVFQEAFFRDLDSGTTGVLSLVCCVGAFFACVPNGTAGRRSCRRCGSAQNRYRSE